MLVTGRSEMCPFCIEKEHVYDSVCNPVAGVLPNAESTSRVQSFPQSLIPVLSAMRAGVILHYPVAHVHSRYPNCPGGKDIIFIPGHFSFFFVTSSSYV